MIALGGGSHSRAGPTKTVTFQSLRREVPGDVPDKVIEWARTVQQRFGEELVDKGYNVAGFPAPVDSGPETSGKGRRVDISTNVTVKDIFGWVLTAWGIKSMRPVSVDTGRSLDTLLLSLKKLIATDAAKHRAAAPASANKAGAPTTKRAQLAAAAKASDKRRAAIPVRAPVGKKAGSVGGSTPGSASSVGKTASDVLATPTATPSKSSSRIAALAAAKHTPSASSPLKPVASASKPTASALAAGKRRIERAVSDDSDIQIIEPPMKPPTTTTIILEDEFKVDVIVDGDSGFVAPPRKRQRRAFIDDADDGGMVEERFVKYIKVCTWYSALGLRRAWR